MLLTKICTTGSSTLPPASITYKKEMNLFVFQRSFTGSIQECRIPPMQYKSMFEVRGIYSCEDSKYLYTKAIILTQYTPMSSEIRTGGHVSYCTTLNLCETSICWFAMNERERIQWVEEIFITSVK
jgi:hypothetical protein